MPSAPRKRGEHRGVLDDLLGAPEPGPVAPPQAPAAGGRPAPAPARAAQRFTISLPAAIIDRIRSAVYYSPDLTLSSLAVAALTREVDRLERQRGEAFPAARGPLRPGRRVR
jgi:hypothetical protein